MKSRKRIQAPEENTDQAAKNENPVARGEQRSKNLKRIHRHRLFFALFIILLMVFTLAFHSGIGTPSSFGVGPFYLICPLGGIEALIASHTFIPQAFISLLVVVAACLIVGRAWCAWGCPVHLTRSIFNSKEAHQDKPVGKSSLWETFKSDSRLWVLAGFLIAVAVVALPVFCLVCPVGLTFGTLMSVWRLIQFNDVNWGLLVFPVALIIELVVYKKWCLKICPLGGLLALFGRFAKPWRPAVDETTCLHAQGKPCKICQDVCIETIDLHAIDAQAQLADCTRCAECKAACPTGSIIMPFIQPKQENASSTTTPPESEVTSGVAENNSE